MHLQVFFLWTIFTASLCYGTTQNIKISQCPISDGLYGEWDFESEGLPMAKRSRRSISYDESIEADGEFRAPFAQEPDWEEYPGPRDREDSPEDYDDDRFTDRSDEEETSPIGPEREGPAEDYDDEDGPGDDISEALEYNPDITIDEEDEMRPGGNPYEEDEFSEAREPNTSAQVTVNEPGFEVSMYVPARWRSRRNVCRRKNIKTRKNAAGSGSSSGFSSSLSSTTSCSGSTDMFRCKLVNKNNTFTVTTSLIWECCSGYSRRPSDMGCPRRDSVPKTFTETVRLNGANQTLTVMNLLNVALPKMRSNSSRWTVFVPNNKAWNAWQTKFLKKMRQGLQIDINNNKTMSTWMETTAKNVLYHFVPRILKISAFTNDLLIPSFRPTKKLRTNLFSNGNVATINCAKIIKRNIKFNGGVIHIIDKVLQPAKSTVFEIAKKAVRMHPILVEALDEIKEEMTAVGPYTFFLFVPSNTSAVLQNGKNCLKKLLRRGLTLNTICTAAFSSRITSRFNNIDNQQLTATVSEDGIQKIDNSRIISQDIMAVDGVVHIIDRPLARANDIGRFHTIEHPLITTLLRNSATATLLSNQTAGARTLLLPPQPQGAVPSYRNLAEAKLRAYMAPVRHTEESLAATLMMETMHNGTTRHVEKTSQSVRQRFGMERCCFKSRFSIDCVNIKSIRKTCDGNSVVQLTEDLPQHNTSLTAILNSQTQFSMMKQWLTQAGLEGKLSSMGNSFKMALVILRNNDVTTLKKVLHPTRSLKRFILSNFVFSKRGLCCGNFKSRQLRIPRWLRRPATRTPRTRGSRRPSRALVYRFEPVSCNMVARNGFVHVMRLRAYSGFTINSSAFDRYWLRRRMAMRRHRARLIMLQRMQQLRRRLQHMIRRRQRWQNMNNDMGFMFNPTK